MAYGTVLQNHGLQWSGLCSLCVFHCWSDGESRWDGRRLKFLLGGLRRQHRTSGVMECSPGRSCHLDSYLIISGTTTKSLPPSLREPSCHVHQFVS